MAPEVAMDLPYNHKSEVYSFAIVLWEMVALQRTRAHAREREAALPHLTGQDQ